DPRVISRMTYATISGTMPSPKPTKKQRTAAMSRRRYTKIRFMGRIVPQMAITAQGFDVLLVSPSKKRTAWVQERCGARRRGVSWTFLPAQAGPVQVGSQDGEARTRNEPIPGRLRRSYGVWSERHALSPLHQGGTGTGGQCVRS